MDGNEVSPGGQVDDEQEFSKDKTYWALWKGSDLAGALSDKEKAYFETARNRGMLSLWICAYAAYHGTTPGDLRDMAAKQIGFEGDELENLRFFINFSRSYTRRSSTMALGEKAAFKAMVVNNDHQSQSRAELADRIVNALYERYSEACDLEVAEGDGFVGSAYTHYRWNFRGGDKMRIDTPVTEQVQTPDGQVVEQPRIDMQGQPVTMSRSMMSGAPVVTSGYPWTYIRETRKSSGDGLWGLVRETESKWNLCAQFPAQRDAILAQGNQTDVYDFGQLFRLQEMEFGNEDLVIVRHFYHSRCDALPEGRYTMSVGDVVLWDGPCPVKEGIPIAEMRSATWIETTFGYCDGNDMLVITQALNQVNSDEITNYANYGRQSVAYEKGTNITQDGLVQGTAYEVPPGAKMPQSMNLVEIPATLPQLKQYLHAQLDLVSGQSSTTRGEPDANIRSGEMAALLDSTTLRYQSFRQQAARRFRIRGANIILDMIDRYGETPFLVEIAGVGNRTYAQEFTREDMSGIERVTMDVINPIMQTVAGRLDIYIKLKDLTPDQRAAAYQLITTGDPSLFIDSDRSTEMLIQRENEDLVTGKRQVFAIAGEDASLHYKRHWSQLEKLLASSNQDQDALARLYSHLEETVQVFIGGSPIVAQLRGVIAPPALGPSAENPAGNPAFQVQMLMSAGMAGAPSPQGMNVTSGTPDDPDGQPSTGQPDAQPQPAPQPAAPQPAAPQTPAQTHPSGTPLPQPSTPPGQ